VFGKCLENNGLGVSVYRMVTQYSQILQSNQMGYGRGQGGYQGRGGYNRGYNRQGGNPGAAGAGRY